jgi:hypothetical protein
LIADDIDERYLNNGIGTFSMFANNNESNQYYTYITQDESHDLWVNGFIIKNMYDYLKFENGLDNFNFLSQDYRMISCKDITYLYPDLQNKREKFETILRKIKTLNNHQKEILLKQIDQIKTNHFSQVQQDSYNMILDNLNNFIKK